MMTQYAAAVTFPDNATAYQTISELRDSSLIQSITAAALVERDQNGQLRVPEGDDSVIGLGAAGGSLVGMLIGVIGGPLGMLLGVSSGALVGGLFDLNRADKVETALAEFGQAVQPGHNALVLQTDEPDTTALDGFVKGKGGTIIRRPLDEVVDELEAQQAAAEAAADAADAKLREQRREERKEKWDERVENLRKKFSRGEK